MMKAVLTGMKEKKEVCIEYVALDGEKTQRTIIPEEFLQTTNFVVVGWDVKKKAYRRFIVENILSAVVSEKAEIAA